MGKTATYDIASQFIRISTNVFLALFVTICIFYFMERLVSVKFQDMEEDDGYTFPDVIHVPEIIEDLNTIEMVEKVPVKETPEIPDLENVDIPNNELSYNMNVTVPSFSNGERNIDFSGMPVPIVMVSPKYPTRAQSRGVEGYVDVRFDINKAGMTENVSVITSSPEGMFEKSAINAVKQWRFKPQMQDGKETVFHGMTRRIAYEME